MNESSPLTGYKVRVNCQRVRVSPYYNDGCRKNIYTYYFLIK